MNMLVRQYRANARKRGINFNLSESECLALFESPCHYCGIEPSDFRKIKLQSRGHAFSGIDRMDNSSGYDSKNSVACCSLCNFAKREMIREDFIAWIKRVYMHSTKQEQSR